MVDENCKTPNGNNQKLHSETVMVPIIGCSELHVDQVHCSIRTTDIDHLHTRIIEGDVSGEKIQVTCGEHNRKQDLALSRNTCTGPAFPYFQQQDDDSSQMRQIPRQPEDVHFCKTYNISRGARAVLSLCLRVATLEILYCLVSGSLDSQLKI